MSEYKLFKGSDQRALAQDIADELNEGITRERHAAIAAAVLTSDWLAAHDRENRAIGWDEGREAESKYWLTREDCVKHLPVNPYRGERP